MVQTTLLFRWQALGDNQAEMTRRFAMQDILSMAVTLVNRLMTNHEQGRGSVLKPAKVMLAQTDHNSLWTAKPGTRNIKKPPQNLQDLEGTLEDVDKDYYRVSDFIEDLFCRMEDSNPEVAQAFMNNVVSELQAFRIRCDDYFGKNTAGCLSGLLQELKKMQQKWKSIVDLKAPVMTSTCLALPEKPISPMPITVISGWPRFSSYFSIKNLHIVSPEKILPDKPSSS